MNLIAKESKKLAFSTVISANTDKVESNSGIEILKRRNALLRRAYDILRIQISKLDRKNWLEGCKSCE